MKRTSRWFVLGLAIAAAGASSALAQPLELTEAELFLELNDTDGDLGIHGSIDGGPYSTLQIAAPRGRLLLDVRAQGPLLRQGLTQLSFESAELGFDELTPVQFLQRFPEGVYEIAIEREGVKAEARARLSHVLPAPPSGITVNGVPAAESCDAPELPTVNGPVVVVWDPVTESHPEIGRSGRVEIARYQFFVEQGDVMLGVDLPPSVTEFAVPEAITAAGGQFKFEIIARAKNLNNTAVETCFFVQN